jgi:hypothetical protein
VESLSGEADLGLRALYFGQIGNDANKAWHSVGLEPSQREVHRHSATGGTTEFDGTLDGLIISARQEIGEYGLRGRVCELLDPSPHDVFETRGQQLGETAV